MMRFWSILIFLCTVHPNFAQEGNDCDLRRNSDGIKVYTCKTGQEKFKLLVAEFILTNTTPRQLKDFVWDISNYKTWQYNTLEAEKVSFNGENELAYRVLADAPWPVENREIIVNMKVVELDSMMRIEVNHIPYQPTPPDDVVRVPFFEASWVIIALDNDLKITYTLRIDPGGSVPAWLVNIAMADGPYVSFKNLKAQLNPQ